MTASSTMRSARSRSSASARSRASRRAALSIAAFTARSASPVDSSMLGGFPLTFSSIGSVGTADVARSLAVAADGRPSVAIARAA